MKLKEYHSGKIGAIVRLTASLVARNPSLANDYERLRANILSAIPELSDKSKCANCGASMAEYIYTLDVFDALLLIAMAKYVRNRLAQGYSFTEANQVEIKKLDVSNTIMCRTTKSSKLGIITQLTVSNKRVSNTWVITRRGWQALRGDAIPKKVKIWRKNIEERFDEKVTLQELIDWHNNDSKRKIARGYVLPKDHIVSDSVYVKTDWYELTTRNGSI